MKKKTIYVGVSLIFVIVLTVLVLRTRATEQKYEKITIRNGDVHKTINVDAVMRPDSYANISSELPAIIEWIGVKENDYVKTGQELFRLNKKTTDAQIKNAKLAVERAELAEQEARRQWDVLKPEARESIKKATEQARQKLNQTSAQAEKTTIISPIDGIVVEQNARIGEVATGIVMKIINPDTLQLEALIPEVDFTKVQSGNSVSIVFDAYLNKRVAGTLQSIDTSSTIEQNSTYYKALVTIATDEKISILDGMNAEVDIEVATKNNVVVVSRELAQKDDDGYFVYILNAGNKKEPFIKKYFKTGLIGGKNIEIISGLKSGDEIIKLIEEE